MKPAFVIQIQFEKTKQNYNLGLKTMKIRCGILAQRDNYSEKWNVVALSSRLISWCHPVFKLPILLQCEYLGAVGMNAVSSFLALSIAGGY